MRRARTPGADGTGPQGALSSDGTVGGKSGETSGAGGPGARSVDASRPGGILAVGDLAAAMMEGYSDPEGIVCLPFSQVTRGALERIRPDVVMSLLVGPDFDCLDLAERLSTAGYRGKYRAVAPQVPEKGMVRREITDRFPGLDFDLVVLEPPD